MPFATNLQNLDKRARIMAYGPVKSKKSWWACRAAEAGFNVLLLDFDDGASIVNQLPQAARERIMVVDLVDDPGRPVGKIFADILARDFEQFAWDEQAKVRAMSTKPEHSYVVVDVTKLTKDDVIVFDSWKALAWSCRYSFALSHNIDLADAKRTDWEGYSFEGNFLDAVVNFIHKVDCHVIVIGHETEYEKRADSRTATSDIRKGEVLWSRTQIKSSSANHALGMLSHFSDILYFKRLSETSVFINTAGDNSRVGGSRHLKPTQYDWNQFPPQVILEMLGGKASGKPSEGIQYIPKGSPAHSIGERKASVDASGVQAVSLTRPMVKPAAK